MYSVLTNQQVSFQDEGRSLVCRAQLVLKVQIVSFENFSIELPVSQSDCNCGLQKEACALLGYFKVPIVMPASYRYLGNATRVLPGHDPPPLNGHS